jgi:hypothetical protein
MFSNTSAGETGTSLSAADEVEVTPEMVQAAFEVMGEYGSLCDDTGYLSPSLKGVVEDMLRAALRVAPFPAQGSVHRG